MLFVCAESAKSSAPSLFLSRKCIGILENKKNTCSINSRNQNFLIKFKKCWARRWSGEKGRSLGRVTLKFQIGRWFFVIDCCRDLFKTIILKKTFLSWWILKKIRCQPEMGWNFEKLRNTCSISLITMYSMCKIFLNFVLVDKELREGELFLR